MALTNTPNVKKALDFATEAHGAQLRKFSSKPYITHPIEVATLLEKYGAPEHVVIAGLLHDVVEDTSVSSLEIRLVFGTEVSELVAEVTDVSKSKDGNRAARKALDRDHLRGCSYSAASLKLADLICNAQGIMDTPPKFAKTYMAEKRLLLEVLRHGNKALLSKATEILLAYEDHQRYADQFKGEVCDQS